MGVTISESEILQDQNERGDLQRMIANVELALANSTPGTRRILERTMEGAKGRVATLDKKIGEAIKERESQGREQAASVALLAQKEARLNESEKQAYSEFLAKDFFTKRDFKSLDQFYINSWERLSDDGKEQMSQRLWEGIRQHEYEFSDLPKSAQEKESKLAYRELTVPSLKQGSLAGISDEDRHAFLAAYQSGNQKDVSHILDRESFAQSMALKSSKGINHQAADDGKQADNQAAIAETKKNGAKIGTPIPASAATAQFGDIDLESVKLKGVVLADVSTSPSSASVPDASGSRVTAR